MVPCRVLKATYSPTRFGLGVLGGFGKLGVAMRLRG